VRLPPMRHAISGARSFLLTAGDAPEQIARKRTPQFQPLRGRAIVRTDAPIASGSEDSSRLEDFIHGHATRDAAQGMLPRRGSEAVFVEDPRRFAVVRHWPVRKIEDDVANPCTREAMFTV
jgi:hypothetical protein